MSDVTEDPRDPQSVAPESAAEVAPTPEPPTPFAELAEVIRAVVCAEGAEGAEVRYFDKEARKVGIGTPSAYVIAQRTGIRWRLLDVRSANPEPIYAEPGELRHALSSALKVTL